MRIVISPLAYPLRIPFFYNAKQCQCVTMKIGFGNGDKNEKQKINNVGGMCNDVCIELDCDGGRGGSPSQETVGGDFNGRVAVPFDDGFDLLYE
jgi:hypothetical protein